MKVFSEELFKVYRSLNIFFLFSSNEIAALPDEVYMLWFREYPFNGTVCKFHKFAAESFTNATVLTITAFTIER